MGISLEDFLAQLLEKEQQAIRERAAELIASQEHARHPHAQVGVDEDELPAGDEAAVGGQFHRRAGVTAQLDDVPRLEIGQAAQGQVHAAQLDGERDGDVERRDIGRG